MVNGITSDNTPVAQPFVVPKTSPEYLLKHEIFDKFAKLGEQTYVFFITGKDGKPKTIRQDQLYQFVSSLSSNPALKNNLITFFSSTNLLRLSRLTQGYVHQIDLGAAAQGKDPIKLIEISTKKSEDSFKGNSPTKTSKTDKEINLAGVPFQVKTLQEKNGPPATENLGQTSYISNNTFCSYTFPGIIKLVREIGYLPERQANEMIEAFKGINGG